MTEHLPDSVLHDPYQLTFDELLHPLQSETSLALDNTFPEAFANELAQQEAFNKHLFRPNTYLHKWWARRCGSTFRAILKQFVSEAHRRDYYAPGGLEGKTVLDPMMGGGTTLHEAIRLGANVIGADIDPIPVVQARTSLTQIEIRNLHDAFDDFFDKLDQDIGHLFHTECPTCGKTLDSQYTLYGQRKKCRCGKVVQVEQYDLRHEADRIVRIHPDTWKITDSSSEPLLSGQRLISKADIECTTCGEKYRELLDTPFYARYVPVAIVAVCPDHGLFFRSPGPADLARIAEADAQRDSLNFGPIKHFAVEGGPKSDDLLRHGVHSYLDLFSSRQLHYLGAAIHHLSTYNGAIRLNLGLLVSTALEFNSLLCGYKGWYARRPGAIRHVFALHAYSFPYTALENNPLNHQKSSGNLRQLFNDRIKRGRAWAELPIERRVTPSGNKQVRIRGEWDGGTEVFSQADLVGQHRFWLIHGDSRRLPVQDHSIDLIVTDPPYYDSVQYSDLAAFFRVWLARLLPDEIDWHYDTGRSAVAVKATPDDSHFMAVISEIFAECGRVLKRGSGRMAFTFHHWDPNAWAELTIALKQAGFRLLSVSVVSSEHPISVHIRGLKAITHDCILTLALNGDGQADGWGPAEAIDTGDSETFCRQCGKTVGWMLASEYPPEMIRDTWNKLVQRT